MDDLRPKLWIAQNGGPAHWRLFDLLRTRASRDYVDPVKAEEVAVRRMLLAIFYFSEGHTLVDAAAKAETSLATAKRDLQELQELFEDLRQTDEPWRPIVVVDGTAQQI